ncbi:hypothetical protein HYV10_00800 [Candidatus Dependentiae bacterium]|nr:hypothetical protein [Candidatus Dependentiae bacterium]
MYKGFIVLFVFGFSVITYCSQRSDESDESYGFYGSVESDGSYGSDEFDGSDGSFSQDELSLQRAKNHKRCYGLPTPNNFNVLQTDTPNQEVLGGSSFSGWLDKVAEPESRLVTVEDSENFTRHQIAGECRKSFKEISKEFVFEGVQIRKEEKKRNSSTAAQGLSLNASNRHVIGSSLNDSDESKR